jgi:glutamine synthetase adenylyltransferase
MMHQFKTHSIPESRDEIEQLAKRVSQGPLARYTFDQFRSTVGMHLNKIRVLSDSFFEGEEVPETSLLLLAPEKDGQASRTLEKYGIEDQGLSIIQSLAYGSFPDLVDRNTRASFQKLLPKLLTACTNTGSPTLALIHFSKIAVASRSQNTFYSFLADSDAAMKLVRNLMGTSSLLTTKLCNNFEILDVLMEDPQSLIDTPVEDVVPWPALAEMTGAEFREKYAEALRTAFDRRLLAAWVLDVQSGTFAEVLSRTITETARRLLTSAFDALVPDSTGVALFALGSFAVTEPHIASDCDLLVVTRDADIEAVTRSVQKLNQVFTDSRLLKLDFRLRGEGVNAPLVQDIGLYRD